MASSHRLTAGRERPSSSSSASRPHPSVSRQIVAGHHHGQGFSSPHRLTAGLERPPSSSSSQRHGLLPASRQVVFGIHQLPFLQSVFKWRGFECSKKRISSSRPKKKKTPTKSAQENSPARIRRRPLVATTNATSPAEDTLSAHHTNHHLRQLVCRYASRSYTTNIVGDQQCWMQL